MLPVDYCLIMSRLVPVLVVAVCVARSTFAAAPDFDTVVGPLLRRHCQSCHDGAAAKGDVDLARFKTGAALAADGPLVETLLEVVGEGFMPPGDAPEPMPAADRRTIVAWLGDRIDAAARAQAGDPGRVVVRRLTNAELNYTLADLTGVARDWARDLPRDGSGGEGFSNTGQTLQMSAGQIEKYLDLAQRLASAAVVFPASGPTFTSAPTPAAEWPRLALERLDAFCTARRVGYEDATPAEQLMSYAYPQGKRPALDFSKTGLQGYKPYAAKRPGDPLQFLLTSFRLFYRNERLCPSPQTFAVPQGALKTIAGQAADADAARHWERLWLDLRHTTGYARPFKVSLLHRWLSFQPYVVGDNPEFEARIAAWKGKRPLAVPADLSFTVMSLAGLIREVRGFSAAELADYENIQNSADGESMGTMAPNHDAFDAFLHAFLSDEQLEAVWRLACDPRSDLARRLGKTPPEGMQAEWRDAGRQAVVWRDQVRAACRESLVEFATRVWRRPLSDREASELIARCDAAVADDQTLTEAVQETLVHLFMSPNFLYRIERGISPRPDQPSAIRPLGAHELAARLSYFLWSSPPDEAVRAAADRGDLADPAGRAAVARRMLRDPRIRRFAAEFFGQWLGFYRFDEFSGPNADRFPMFDADLRRAMHGEAVDFCTDLVANDRDVRLLLRADYAFLPSRQLAEHYGLTDLGPPGKDAWSAQAGQSDGVVTTPRMSLAGTPRRGMLGWGAALTATSHPLRTSPVLRGNWILSELLGMPTPPPPEGVPDLPEDERNEAGQTVAQLLARHRADAACSACHERIDPLGIALENFDPVGRWRTHDVNGRPIESTSRLGDERRLEGMAGLVAFLNEERQERLFVRRLCRKLLGYALGRSVQPGDRPLLESIEDRLWSTDGRFSTIIEGIVTSAQFASLRFEPATSPGENQP